MPTSASLVEAIKTGKEIGCTSAQIFTASPRQWFRKPLEQELIENFHQVCEDTGIHPIISHDTYLVNLCATNPETQTKSIQNLTQEMHRCSQLGITYVVSHMGAHLEQDEQTALKIVAEKTKQVLSETPDDVYLCMETTSGQGSALNYRFEQIATLLEACQADPRLVVCLDTCHIFAAGYDIRTPETYEQTFQEFNRLIGIDRIKVIHCNDSKKPLGSRVDRHEHIGQGEIGEEAFRLLVNDPRFYDVPIILETPDAATMHAQNLQKLKELIVS